MLMKVVLPAPLLPINPTTLSCSMRTLMSSAAVTAPKRFERPFASRIVAISSGAPARAECGPESAGQDDHDQQHGDAERHLPGVGKAFERKRAHGFEDARAEERCEDAAGAPQNRDEHEFAGSGPVGGRLRIDVADRACHQRAADAGQSGTDHIVQVNYALD